MSFGTPQDYSSRPITAGLFAIAVIAVPIACLAALEALITFGFWSGTALIIRLACLASPLFVFTCLELARTSNREGRYRKALVLLAMVLVPTAMVLAYIARVSNHP